MLSSFIVLFKKNELVGYSFLEEFLVDLIFIPLGKTQSKINFFVGDLLEDCQGKLKQTNKKVSFEKNLKDLILKIGSP